MEHDPPEISSHPNGESNGFSIISSEEGVCKDTMDVITASRALSMPSRSGLLQNSLTCLIVMVHSLLGKMTCLPFPIGAVVESMDDILEPLTHPIVEALEGYGLQLTAALDDQLSVLVTIAEDCILSTAEMVYQVFYLLQKRGFIGMSADLWVQHEALLREKAHFLVDVANKIPLVNLVTPVVCAVAAPLATVLSEWLVKHSQSEDKSIQYPLTENFDIPESKQVDWETDIPHNKDEKDQEVIKPMDSQRPEEVDIVAVNEKVGLDDHKIDNMPDEITMTEVMPEKERMPDEITMTEAMPEKERMPDEITMTEAMPEKERMPDEITMTEAMTEKERMPDEIKMAEALTPRKDDDDKMPEEIKMAETLTPPKGDNKMSEEIKMEEILTPPKDDKTHASTPRMEIDEEIKMIEPMTPPKNVDEHKKAEMVDEIREADALTPTPQNEENIDTVPEKRGIMGKLRVNKDKHNKNPSQNDVTDLSTVLELIDSGWLLGSV